MSKYSVHQEPINTLLTWIKTKDVAVPEIQRPFVWSSIQVRDLIDSLYKGYPVGYIIIWRNPNIRLKDGKLSDGKRILIDGQQRITALNAAILGESVLNKYYEKYKIKIAFHPLDRKFEVLNPAIEKDSLWIKDISPVITNEVRTSQLIRHYKDTNPLTDEIQIEDAVEELKAILNKPIGIIELAHDLDIETVTEIFIRINSKGTILSQADFVMSKIAADEKYGGNTIRKCIDYFCHIYMEPEYMEHIIENDVEYTKTGFYRESNWIAKSDDELYYPEYSDILRVAFTYKFNRGKFSDLVSLLSGRNFEKKIFEEAISENSFTQLKEGILGFINQTNYERFVMIIQSIGFYENDFIISKSALNFSYVIYLKLKDLKYSSSNIESFVKKWFVLSILTSRYSGSSESAIDYDIRSINEKSIDKYLAEIESSELGDAFWENGLYQDLDSSSLYNPAFTTFIALQVRNNRRGFLSKDITIKNMLDNRGDIHHIFPKDILKKLGYGRSVYNKVANQVYAQQEINIKIGKKEPYQYMEIVKTQCETGVLKLGNISDHKDLLKNLQENAIPTEIFDYTIEEYDTFLNQRRRLIAMEIRKFYENL